MESKKVKLSLKKETIEILNQNEMSSFYGGVVTINCTGDTCNSKAVGCDSLYCSAQAAGCAGSLACASRNCRPLRPNIPLSDGCIPVVHTQHNSCESCICYIVTDNKACLENQRITEFAPIIE